MLNVWISRNSGPEFVTPWKLTLEVDDSGPLNSCTKGPVKPNRFLGAGRHESLWWQNCGRVCPPSPGWFHFLHSHSLLYMPKRWYMCPLLPRYWNSISFWKPIQSHGVRTRSLVYGIVHWRSRQQELQRACTMLMEMNSLKCHVPS